MHEAAASPIAAPSPDQDWPSLDVVYAEVQNSIVLQNDRLKNIDTKANFALASATLLTAGVTGLGRALADAGRTGAVPSWTIQGLSVGADSVVDWVTVLSLGIYALIVFCTYNAYQLRDFMEAPDPAGLVSRYVHEDSTLTKATITKERAKNYARTEAQINVKARWTALAMRLLVVEALLLFLITIIQVIWL
jgi:hypothetical protein